jgi:hypothetical protein
MTQYSSIRVMEHFFDMLIKFIRRVSTKKMEYFEGIGTWRNFPTIFRQLSDHFPSTFRPFSVNFPTKESKSNGKQREANPHPSWLHSSTLPLRHTYFLCILRVSLWISLIAFYLLLSFVSTLFIFVITVLCCPLLVLWLPSSVLCFPSSVLFSWRKWIFYSILF